MTKITGSNSNTSSKQPLDQVLELIVDKVARIDLVDYEKYLEELSQVGVKLDEDPTAAGLSSLNIKIAQVDTQKTRLGYILTQAIDNENNVELVNSFIVRVYDKRRADLLQSEEVSKLSSQPLREAAVLSRLEILLDIQNDIKQMLSKAKTFTKIVQQTFNMLDSTNKNLSRQLTTIQAMIDINEIIKKSPEWDGNNK